jgi:hypothetical protein
MEQPSKRARDNRGAGEPDGGAGDGHFQGVPHHHPAYAAAARTERDANGILTAALLRATCGSPDLEDATIG